MLQANDPFEAFKAKKKIERLEKKFKTGGTEAKCPQPGEDKGGTPGADDSRNVLFDPKRAWIY